MKATGQHISLILAVLLVSWLQAAAAALASTGASHTIQHARPQHNQPQPDAATTTMAAASLPSLERHLDQAESSKKFSSSTGPARRLTATDTAATATAQTGSSTASDASSSSDSKSTGTNSRDSGTVVKEDAAVLRRSRRAKPSMHAAQVAAITHQAAAQLLQQHQTSKQSSKVLAAGKSTSSSNTKVETEVAASSMRLHPSRSTSTAAPSSQDDSALQQAADSDGDESPGDSDAEVEVVEEAAEETADTATAAEAAEETAGSGDGDDEVVEVIEEVVEYEEVDGDADATPEANETKGVDGDGTTRSSSNQDASVNTQDEEAAAAAQEDVPADPAADDGEYVSLLPAGTAPSTTDFEEAQIVSTSPTTAADKISSVGTAAVAAEEDLDEAPVVKKPAHLAKVYIAELPGSTSGNNIRSSKKLDASHHHSKAHSGKLHKHPSTQEAQPLQQTEGSGRASSKKHAGHTSVDALEDTARLQDELVQLRLQVKLAEKERETLAGLRKQKHRGQALQLAEDEQDVFDIPAAKSKHHVQARHSDAQTTFAQQQQPMQEAKHVLRQQRMQEDMKKEEEEREQEEKVEEEEAQQELEPRSHDMESDVTPDESHCFKPLLQYPFFSRERPSSLNNAYVAMLLARYAYPTAFGININTNASRTTYQELFRRKWIAMGAKPNTIYFQDVGGSGSRLHRLIKSQQPEAHSVVFGTSTDVWIAYRGLTSVDSALTSDMRHTPTQAAFGGRNVAVHSGFYNGFRAIWPQVLTAVKQAIMQTEEPAQAKIFITGHSLGGAHAVFTALKLVDMKAPSIGGIYLFGAPRMGQQSFMKLFADDGLEPLTFHWWNELDMVPNLGTSGPWKRARFVPLPETTLYRIWGGECHKAAGSTAQTCPLGSRRCRKSVNDHRAFSYVAKLQACVLQQPSIESSSCMSSKVMSSM